MEQLSELEKRILSELEEAGEEDVPTMLNTVTDHTGDPMEIEEMQKALRALVHADLARMAVRRDEKLFLVDSTKDESLAIIDDLETGLRFVSEEGFWTDRRAGGPPFQNLFEDEFRYIVYTESGKAMGFQILDERGYQWWRKGK